MNSANPGATLEALFREMSEPERAKMTAALLDPMQRPAELMRLGAEGEQLNAEADADAAAYVERQAARIVRLDALNAATEALEHGLVQGADVSQALSRLRGLRWLGAALGEELRTSLGVPSVQARGIKLTELLHAGKTVQAERLAQGQSIE